MKKERIDKLIASQGLLSRNDVKTMIKRGEVSVNGVVIKDSSVKVSYEDDIVVNGKPLKQTEFTYIMLNKPKGVVSASEDKRDKTVVDILPDELKRKNLFPAGRLDKDTTGFCLITDDGDFAHRILSPSRHVDKTYIATVDKKINFANARKAFKDGIVLADGTVLLSADLELLSDDDNQSFKVVIKEGKYHQVKRMFASLGTTVIELKRISIGGLALDDNLEEGEARLLTAEELSKIENR
ncbi:MAG: rRNA pseudouridine synthase [Clostridia bacterium]|nr:rRNA pseudouridine synthase [Clostridia bacterium]MBO5432660.1 rRNA pseudouridine synthase [Clostridia bacterium]